VLHAVGSKEWIDDTAGDRRHIWCDKDENLSDREEDNQKDDRSHSPLDLLRYNEGCLSAAFKV
jgi:hypothetical protein